MEGKVWLVGAGPGDIGLLTVKGKTLLENADVIVYDHLIGNEIISSLDDRKKLINVGKLSGHHPIPQKQINQILVDEAKKGQKVVRLKGGDPFLFGRGGEELAELKKCGIPFEVVPGVTSSLAVPAYNGIPVTHRDFASSVHIITGHKKHRHTEDKNQGCAQETDYRALAAAGGTLVFLMGVTALPDIRRELLEAGMDPDTPAAVLQEGTTAGQKKVTAVLGDLEERAKEAGICPPAVIVVGQVCRLSETLSWREDMPLFGRRIILTRPRQLMSALAERLRRLGAEVLEFPVIDTVPDEGNEKVSRRFEQIESYHWIVFTSQVGVQTFFEQMQQAKLDIRKISRARFAVIGEGTGAALWARGIRADLMPDVYDGESLGRALAKQGIEGSRILIARARKGNEQLVPILEQAGALVDDAAIYRTVYHAGKMLSRKEELEEEIAGKAGFEKEKPDLVVFTSSSTVEGFVSAMGETDFSRIKAVCIGRQTAETAAEYHMECYTAKKATLDALIERILELSS